MGTRDIVAMLAATAAAFAPAAARAYEVAPMIVELEPSGEAARGAMDVRNTGDQPIAVAVSLLDRSTSEPVDPETVSIFPFQATIGPLETQRFRIEWFGARDLSRSKSWYVQVEQLPIGLGEGAESTAMAFVVNFLAELHVTPPGTAPGIRIERWSADGLVIANDGDRYGYAADQDLRAPSGAVARADAVLEAMQGDSFLAPGERVTLALAPPAGDHQP